MVALIREKRRAIKEARPQDREVLARELHNLILEKSQSGRWAAPQDGERRDSSDDPGIWRTEMPEMGLNARMREKTRSQADLKLKILEHKEEVLRQQEARRKMLDRKSKQAEKKGNALEE
jgi:hypothetical protein